MIRVECPKCRQWLEIEDEGAGLELGCPACGGEVVIPKHPTPQLRLVRPSSLSVRGKSTAAQAGAVCLGICALVLVVAAIWIKRNPTAGMSVLYLAVPFGVVAVICAVVAMCTNQLWRGLAVVIGTVAALGLAGVLAFQQYRQTSAKDVQDAQQLLENQLEDVLKLLNQ